MAPPPATKKALVVFFSLSGQTKRIVQSITAGFESGGCGGPRRVPPSCTYHTFSPEILRQDHLHDDGDLFSSAVCLSKGPRTRWKRNAIWSFSQDPPGLIIRAAPSSPSLDLYGSRDTQRKNGAAGHILPWLLADALVLPEGPYQRVRGESRSIPGSSHTRFPNPGGPSVFFCTYGGKIRIPIHS